MTTQPRDNAGVIAPPPLIYLGGVAVGIIADSFLPVPRILFPGQAWFGGLLTAAGFVLSIWSVLEFVRHGTHPDPRHPTTVLITVGPYRFSRNPIYLAFTLMYLGVASWLGKFWILTGVVPALLLTHFGVVRREERYLSGKFGGAYEAYRQRVRRWL